MGSGDLERRLEDSGHCGNGEEEEDGGRGEEDEEQEDGDGLKEAEDLLSLKWNFPLLLTATAPPLSLSVSLAALVLSCPPPTLRLLMRFMAGNNNGQSALTHCHSPPSSPSPSAISNSLF